jgi:hypothetical protein
LDSEAAVASELCGQWDYIRHLSIKNKEVLVVEEQADRDTEESESMKDQK